MARQLLTVDEARARVLAAVRALPAETVALGEALGRVLAQDVVADIVLPPFDSSAMDGFALVAGSGGELSIIGEARAGAPFAGSVQSGQAVRVSTGAVVPDGANAVVPIERAEESGSTLIAPATEPGAHIRRAGEDVGPGDLVIAAGGEIGPAEIGMLAAFGRSGVRVARRPRIAIAVTGDELRQPGERLEPGQIYDSNAATIGALVQRAGADALRAARIPDEADATISALDAASEDADALVVSGGVSVGPHDHVKGSLADIGFEELIWGVSLKPGKPFWFGTRGDQCAFGLPGNPVSAMVTFQLFVRPALRALQGADPSATRSSAVLDGPIRANADRDQAVRCRLRIADDGWHCEPTGPQGSHVISSMVGAAALAIVPAGGRDLRPGERVEIELL